MPCFSLYASCVELAFRFERKMPKCQVYLNPETGFLEVECARTNSYLLKRIGTLGWNAARMCWSMGFTLKNVKSLVREFDVDADPDTCEAISELEIQEERVSEILTWDDLKCERDILHLVGVEKAFDVPLRIPKFKSEILRDFQKRGILFALRRGSALICDHMGLGKTLQALGYALMLRAQGKAKQCLVVVLSSLKHNWREEIEKFCTVGCTVVEGTAAQRRKLWRSRSFFLVVSYDILVSDLGMKKRTGVEAKTDAIAPDGFDVIMLDEVHKIKNHTSQRTMAIKFLKSRYRLGLTGTPVDGALLELHSIMEFIQPGVFPRKWEFVDRYCEVERRHGRGSGERGWVKIVGEKNVPDFKRVLRPYYIRRLKDEVVPDMPPKAYSVFYVDLSPKERELYEQYKSDALASTNMDGFTMTVRFKQICDSPELVGEEDVPSSKMEMFLEIIEELALNGFKVLVFSQYLQMCKIMKRVLKEKGYPFLEISGSVRSSKKRQETVKRFNADDTVPFLLCTDAGSHGLNIQASDYVIHYDDSWSPAVMEQREDRSHRIGRVGKVNVIRFVTKDTIEERVIEVLDRKKGMKRQLFTDDQEVVRRMFTTKEIKTLI